MKRTAVIEKLDDAANRTRTQARVDALFAWLDELDKRYDARVAAAGGPHMVKTRVCPGCPVCQGEPGKRRRS